MRTKAITRRWKRAIRPEKVVAPSPPGNFLRDEVGYLWRIDPLTLAAEGQGVTAYAFEGATGERRTPHRRRVDDRRHHHDRRGQPHPGRLRPRAAGVRL